MFPSSRSQLSFRLSLLAMILAAGGFLTALAGPSYGQPKPGAGGNRPAVVMERLRGVLRELDLTEEQRRKTDALLDNTAGKLRESAGGARGDNDGRRGKFQETMAEMRQQLMQVLTPAQQQALREKMQQGDGGGALRRQLGTDDKPGNKPSPDKSSTDSAKPKTLHPTDPKMTDPKMSESMMEGASKPEAAKPKAVVAPEDAGPAAPIEPGLKAPDFKLKKLDGSLMQLSSMSGRVIVLVFGSYSDPIFRGRAASIQRLHEDLGTRATVFLVYTKEAHPVGGWELEKNKEQNIFINQPLNFAGRQTAAKQCREALKLTLPILIDDIDNAWTSAYGGFPNGAVVINRDGTIAASQQWAEPTALRRAIDNAIARNAKSPAK